MHRATQVIVVVLGLMAATAIAIAVVRRARNRTAIEMTLARDLQSGMPIAEATAVLRRLDVPFTVDSSAVGTTVIRYGREVTRDSRMSTEQQLVFDHQGRLREMLTAARISGP
jgi:hypothetical protein